MAKGPTYKALAKYSSYNSILIQLYNIFVNFIAIALSPICIILLTLCSENTYETVEPKEPAALSDHVAMETNPAYASVH